MPGSSKINKPSQGVAMTPTIRISPLPALSPDTDRVLVQALLPEGARMQAAVEYAFSVNTAEVDDLGWYFENFLEFDDEPAPTMARRIERNLRNRGRELFDSVLASNKD